MDQEISAEAREQIAIWREQGQRFLFPIAVTYEGEVSLSEAADRLRKLAHPTLNMFSAEWQVTLEENDLGLPFAVNVLRSFPRSRSRSPAYRRNHPAVKRPSNAAEGLLRHNLNTRKTTLTASIHFGMEAIISAATATLGIGIVWLFGLSSITSAPGPMGFWFSLVVTLILLAVPLFQWARLFRDRYKLMRALEGVVTNSS